MLLHCGLQAYLSNAKQPNQTGSHFSEAEVPGVVNVQSMRDRGRNYLGLD